MGKKLEESPHFSPVKNDLWFKDLSERKPRWKSPFLLLYCEEWALLSRFIWGETSRRVPISPSLLRRMIVNVNIHLREKPRKKSPFLCCEKWSLISRFIRGKILGKVPFALSLLRRMIGKIKFFWRKTSRKVTTPLLRRMIVNIEIHLGKYLEESSYFSAAKIDR